MSCQRYGGFDSIKPAYIAAISYQKGKQRAGALVNVPIYLAEAIEKNPKVLVDYLEKDYPGVVLLENPYYAECNNIASLYVAREYIENAIIMDGDQIIYNPEILSTDFVYSGYSSVWTDERTDEWLQTL